MKVVGLVSGGKDSCYSLCRAAAAGHDVVAVAHLTPADQQQEETDSHCFQTVAHAIVPHIAKCIGVPCYTRGIAGSSVHTGLGYSAPVSGDEVEDLVDLLRDVLASHPHVRGVVVGAILSSYQRLRVEHVCARLGLTALAPLWEHEQESLLDEMISNGVTAVLVKVASMGLEPRRHLGRTLGELQQHLLKIGAEYGVNVCGEGGEYETLTLDCPIFRQRLVLHDTEAIGDLHTSIAPVGTLRIGRVTIEEKVGHDPLAACRAMKRTARFTSGEDPMRNDESEAEIEQSMAGLAVSAVAQPASLSAPLFSLPSESDALPAFADANVVSDHAFVACAASPAIPPAESESSEEPIARAVGSEIERVYSVLQSRGFTPNDACFASLFLADMQRFAQANEAYVKRVPQEQAAARACVQLADPARAFPAASADLLACRGAPRSVLHVQSISEWAPACIGPYSQAARLTCGLMTLAGQIGLDPARMTLPSPARQLPLAWRHVRQVLHASSGGRAGLQHSLGSVVYWSEEEHARRSTLGAWNTALRQCAELARGSSSSASSVAAVEAPLLHVVVPALPRAAAVEVQLLALSPLPAPLPAAKSFTLPLVRDEAVSGACVSTRGVAQSGLLVSVACSLAIPAPASDASLQPRPAEHLQAAANTLVDSIVKGLKHAKLRWKHVLVFRIYYSADGVSERSVRVALASAISSRKLPLPAISFLPVSRLEPLDADLSSAAQPLVGVLAAHVLAMSQQMASRDFNPCRVWSDDEEEDHE